MWLYAVASVVGGAWISPWLYNAGKALAEVTESKRTNGLLDGLAAWCRSAGFPDFYTAGLLFAAVALFLPLIEWLRLGGRSDTAGSGPWSVRLSGRARLGPGGQPLQRNRVRLAHLTTGFLLAGVLFLMIGYGLVGAGSFTWQDEAAWPSNLGKLLAVGLLWVGVQECAFRGIALGIFLRWLRPAGAIALAALLFAAAHSVLPAGQTVADPERAGVGFELLGKVLARWIDPEFLVIQFLPVLTLGALLGFARWRTASLALPMGLHAGWIVSAGLFQAFTIPIPRPGLLPRLLAGGESAEGLLVVAGLLMVGTLIYQFTRPADDVPEF